MVVGQVLSAYGSRMTVFGPSFKEVVDLGRASIFLRVLLRVMSTLSSSGLSSEGLMRK